MPRSAPVVDLPPLPPKDAALAARYPDFLPRPHAHGLSEAALAARNVRKLLKRTYPGVKFSVKAEASTMSASVNIGWDGFPDAPEEQAVKALTRIFKAGEFDGMSDGYNYTQDEDRRAFGRLFGSVEYVFASQKKVTPAMLVAWETKVLRHEIDRVSAETTVDQPLKERARPRL